MNRRYRNLKFQGRLGNQLFQYAWAKAYCEREGYELRVDSWLGQKCFELNDPPIEDNYSDFVGYHQTQDDLIYTRSQVRSWLKWKPEIAEKLNGLYIPKCAAHVRRGDYVTSYSGLYVTVSEDSYFKAVAHFHLGAMWPVAEEFPVVIPGFPPWLPDFYRLTKAQCLLRANSTYSWWAHVLADDSQRIFAPVIEGKPPGWQDCDFVEGNWPRFHDRGGVTDLHLTP